MGATSAEWVALIRAGPQAFLKLIDNIIAKPEVNDINFWGLHLKKSSTEPDVFLEWQTCA